MVREPGPELSGAEGTGFIGRATWPAFRRRSGRAWPLVLFTKLGDAADDQPEHWEAAPPFAARGVHAMLMVWAQSQAELDARLAEFGAQADEAGGITLVGFQPVAALGGSGREHFGYRDPISQPAIAGDRSADVGADGEEPIAAGEFLLGYPDELGRTPTTLTAEARP